MDAMFPYENNPYSTTKKEYFSFAIMIKWTNLKAVLAGAGAGGKTCKDFTAFSINEVRQHLRLYILNGINPSPHIEYKFKPQQEDGCHGNALVYNSFGPGAAH